MALTLMASSRGLHPAHVVSAGNQAVVDAVDVMSFFLSESRIRVIAAVIEGLSDVPKFRRVATQAAERDVPIVALKLGRSEKASRAAVAHTGSLTGSDQLYDALFKQYGVIRVDDSRGARRDGQASFGRLPSVRSRPGRLRQFRRRVWSDLRPGGVLWRRSARSPRGDAHGTARDPASLRQSTQPARYHRLRLGQPRDLRQRRHAAGEHAWCRHRRLHGRYDAQLRPAFGVPDGTR